MKGLILAAGRGTRLRPLTDSRSKPMVLLANRPLIHYSIDKLVEVGITEIGIVVGENEAELRAGLDYPGDAALTFLHQPHPGGLAHAVSFAEEYTGYDDFVLLFCDNLFSASLHDSVDEWRRVREDNACDCLIHVHAVPDPRASGVAVVKDGWVMELEEKPQQPKSNLAIAGIDFFTPRIYGAISRIKPSARGELEITDAIAELVKEDAGVRALELEGFWYDTGTFGDLLAAQAAILGSPELRPPSASSAASGTDTQIVEPVAIGAGSQLQSCRLGPNVSVADNCRLDNCQLRDCQVYPGTTLRDVTASRAIFDGERHIDVGAQV